MIRPKLAFLSSPSTFGYLHRRAFHNKVDKRNPRVGSGRVRMTSTITEEHFDVLHEDGTHKGFAKPRSQVHRDGDWHRSTHIWVITNDAQVLVQKRAVGKDTFPERWDVSAAGHITAGDVSAASARRELEEELGIALKDENELRFVMSVKASATGETERHGKYKDNEIQDIYIYNISNPVPPSNFVLQEEEVEAIEYWRWVDYCRRSNSRDEALVPRSEEYRNNFFPWLSDYFENNAERS